MGFAIDRCCLGVSKVPCTPYAGASLTLAGAVACRMWWFSQIACCVSGLSGCSSMHNFTCAGCRERNRRSVLSDCAPAASPASWLHSFTPLTTPSRATGPNCCPTAPGPGRYVR